MENGSGPVFQDDEGWWFWNEIWADKYGPYETEEKARRALSEYVEKYL